MIKSKALAAALLAIQITVTAMPISAAASETEQFEEIAQEQETQEQAAQEQVEQEQAAPVEEEPAPAETEKENEQAELTDSKESSSEEAEEEPAEETTDNVKEEADEAEQSQEQEQPETPEQPETAENGTTKPEETDLQDKDKAKETVQNKVFDQTVTVDGVKVNVKAEEGAFEDGAVLSVTKVPADQKDLVEKAVTAARTDKVNSAASYVFDIKILGQDGSTLKPADNKKVTVTFQSDYVANTNNKVEIYHITGNANEKLTARKLETAVNRYKKTAVAQTDSFSYFTVEFTSFAEAYKAETEAEPDKNVDPDTNTDPETNADPDTNTDTGKNTDTDKNTDSDMNTNTDKDKAVTKPDTASTPAVNKNTAVAKNTDQSVNEKKNTKSEEKKSVKSDDKKKKKQQTNNSDKKKEKAKTESKTNKSPTTGDRSEMAMWFALGLLAVGGLAGAAIFRKKYSE